VSWLTVIIPCYNYSALLTTCVNSLSQSSIKDWECIIVDDGSTDDTRTVASDLAEQDQRIKYIFQKNAGASSARNRGLAAASGEWVGFLDADDYYLPGALDWFRHAVETVKEAKIVSGDRTVSGIRPRSRPDVETEPVLMDLFFPALHFALGPTPFFGNTVLHRSVFDAIGGACAADYMTIEDRELFVRATAHYQVLVGNYPVAHYNRGHNSKSVRYAANGEKLRTHRDLYERRIVNASVVTHRLEHRTEENARFYRMRNAYLAMLTAAEAESADDLEAAVAACRRMANDCRTDEERSVLLNKLVNFSRGHPAEKGTLDQARGKSRARQLLVAVIKDDTMCHALAETAAELDNYRLRRGW
jgi:glycosyltransferase involved in cell wall biosynthesis